MKPVLVFPSRLVTTQIKFDALGFPNVAFEANAELVLLFNGLKNGIVYNKATEYFLQ